jgi:hypothetical protein
MSRSRPNENSPNPATRWYEWHGERGIVTYYDKEQKASIDVPLPFTFIVLDQLSAVKGWDDSTKSGIFSNAVRDTREEVLTVKSFKGGIIAEGRYKDIKPQVNAAGGHFESQIYIAYKAASGLAIGTLSFKGAALGAWMEFSRAHRAAIQSDAIVIPGFVEGQKGRVIFRVPAFAVKALSAETNEDAIKLDATLQEWLDAYLKRNKQTAPTAPDHDDDLARDSGDRYTGMPSGPITEDDIPF